jgi:uncharacterized protein YciI
MGYDVDDEKINEVVAKSKMYGMIVLERGPGYVETKMIMPAHATYWIRMKEDGLVLTNGPVFDDTNIVGMGVFRSDDLEAIKELMDADPGVISGRFRYRMMRFRGVPGDRLE